MRRLFGNTSIYGRAIGLFLLLAVPVTLIVVLGFLSVHGKLAHIEANPELYSSEVALFKERDSIRTAAVWLRSLAPGYEKSDDLSDFYRDMRVIIVILWAVIVIAGLILVNHMARQIQGRMSAISRSVKGLLDQDLEKVVRIGGPLDLVNIGQLLDKLRLQLSKNERRQVQFLQNVSHDIKTPLTSINEGIRLLNDDLLGALNDEQREVSQIILKNTNELQSSIESLLEYNRASATRGEAARETLDIGSVLEQVINDQKLPIRAKNIKVKLDKTVAFSHINKAQITTVFENILSNAIRYAADEGEIHISLSSDMKVVQILFQDDGPGIPEHQREAVFNAFFVGKKPAETGLKGTGLGLSIALQFIEAHQGTVEVLDPDLGELPGALLCVCLPAHTVN